MNFEIIPFSSEYIDAVETLEKRCFSDPFTRAMLEFTEQSDRAAAYVALCGGTVAGYVELFDFVDTLSVNTIETAPEYRRQGLATRLMRLAYDEAEKRGIDNITLEARVSNAAARAFYEKEGFTELGVRKNYYEKPREDAVTYIKRI